MSSPSAAIIGSTGLVGSNILSTLLASEIYNPVHTITRRAPKAISPHLNALGQDADVIAKAAVRAAQLASEGKAPSKYWILSGSDIIKLGRTE
jgi:uncharacterized protein YbjT (DUF2867 family)